MEPEVKRRCQIVVIRWGEEEEKRKETVKKQRSEMGGGGKVEDRGLKGKKDENPNFFWIFFSKSIINFIGFSYAYIIFRIFLYSLFFSILCPVFFLFFSLFFLPRFFPTWIFSKIFSPFFSISYFFFSLSFLSLKPPSKAFNYFHSHLEFLTSNFLFFFFELFYLNF